jgi:hypothetical protein
MNCESQEENDKILSIKVYYIQFNGSSWSWSYDSLISVKHMRSKAIKNNEHLIKAWIVLQVNKRTKLWTRAMYTCLCATVNIFPHIFHLKNENKYKWKPFLILWNTYLSEKHFDDEYCKPYNALAKLLRDTRGDKIWLSS